jgi:hypothetical protein
LSLSREALKNWLTIDCSGPPEQAAARNKVTERKPDAGTRVLRRSMEATSCRLVTARA